MTVISREEVKRLLSSDLFAIGLTEKDLQIIDYLRSLGLEIRRENHGHTLIPLFSLKDFDELVAKSK